VLCACVSEEHRDGEGSDWWELSRLSYTREYISLAAEEVNNRCSPPPTTEDRENLSRFTRLSYTGSAVELEHLKIKTRLTNEKFASVKGECEI
jgi:hypothetical protein